MQITAQVSKPARIPFLEVTKASEVWLSEAFRCLWILRLAGLANLSPPLWTLAEMKCPLCLSSSGNPFGAYQCC